ncbi:hypothetical protein E0Z10_g1842 [Xylaria hypoxylon]|uniref:DUF7143 domain-containing protein n=1 Tax=Xylaria hypoxylon TaxID=37992 RepID=A0A4Z0ZBL6_9PEZI|nr:hypothetical protein E0Z10_g1842 [Xylaria hypoxylon]
MHSSLPIIALAGIAAALPTIPFVSSLDVIPIRDGPVAIAPRQSQACFVIGSTELPQEVADVADSLANVVSCSSKDTTIAGVPDVTAGSTTFSSIDFSQSDQSPLQFALSSFATEEPVANTDLQVFQDALNAYLATEAGIRSVGGSLAIKVPKFFLELQVSRIQTAQGNPPTAAGLQVDHLRDKVLKNAAGEDKALLDQVTALATQLQ